MQHGRKRWRLTVLPLVLAVLAGACAEDAPTEPRDRGTPDPDPEPTTDFWRAIDVTFADDRFGASLPNQTDIADFDRDGDLDIVTIADGALVLFRNSGSGSLFSAGDQTTLLDPADVDPAELDHWASELSDFGTFGFGDYNRDGYPDAVVAARWNGTPRTAEPIVFLAWGDGRSLDPALPLDPGMNESSWDPATYTIVGSHFMQSRQALEVMFYEKQVNSSVHWVMHPHPYSAECPNGIVRINYEDERCRWPAEGDGTDDIPVPYNGVRPDELRTPTGTYLAAGGAVYSSIESKRRVWGASFPHQPSFVTTAVQDTADGWVQSAVGELAPNEFAFIDFHRSHSIDRHRPVGVVSIVPNFENRSPLRGSPFTTFRIEGASALGGTALELTGDGLDDLVVALGVNDSVEVAVWENRGDYEFERGRTLYRTFVPFLPENLKVRPFDFDLDGRPDLYIEGLGLILIQES